ncbi:Transposon Tf2-2 polyprotein [Vitis vinifera]|uniref:Transposon Tf2-2 polyprotein n=1 Tax=Vitis vinifera TaxID=29760 RepID=A0A438FJH7_VITVI|nr:Transposon Tf2-2 polyprotein [Vitis vinifera]
MPFGLTNALVTFCNLMNDVLFDYLDAFVVVYLDDIVVYSKTLTEHEKHLRLVFQILRKNRLYVKPEKCEFAQEEITFLGHKISVSLIRMDKGKKDNQWDWSMQCQMAFEGLKEAISTKPERHPVAFESRKLNNAEQRYSTHEKEMTTVVHCLQQWRHYLLGSIFTVEFLADFKFEWLHGPGRHNTVTDALSRKEVIAYITTLSEVIFDLNEKIKQAAEQDVAYGRLKQQVKKGVIMRYWLEGDLLVAKGGRWYVPTGDRRKELLRETHDAKWAGHPGEERTLALLAKSY